jgi:hypothetical protein
MKTLVHTSMLVNLNSPTQIQILWNKFYFTNNMICIRGDSEYLGNTL